MAERNYRWFIEPGNADTNAIVARNCSEEDCYTQQVCADGIRRNLWTCSKKVRDSLIANKIRLKLSFTVFRMELPCGKIKNVNFIFNSKKSEKKPQMVHEKPRR